MRLSPQSSARWIAVLALTAGPSLAPAAQDAEMVDSKVYKSWADVKPGTVVKYINKIKMGPTDITSDMTQTLVSVTPEKVTVEMVVTVNAMGRETKQPAVKKDYPAKVAKGSEALPQNMKGESKELPDEDVTIGGKTYACKVTEFSGKSDKGGPMGEMSGRMYRSDDVPGGMVKMTGTFTGQMAGGIEISLTSVEEGK